MDLEIIEGFMDKWRKYFPGSELPIACFYADVLDGVDDPDAPKTNKSLVCISGQLTPVRSGKAGAFNPNNVGCFGASGMFGFANPRIPKEMENCYDFLIKESRRLPPYFQSKVHMTAQEEVRLWI